MSYVLKFKDIEDFKESEFRILQLGAGFGFKSCEKGENFQMMLSKLRETAFHKDGDKK